MNAPQLASSDAIATFLALRQTELASSSKQSLVWGDARKELWGKRIFRREVCKQRNLWTVANPSRQSRVNRARFTLLETLSESLDQTRRVNAPSLASSDYRALTVGRITTRVWPPARCAVARKGWLSVTAISGAARANRNSKLVILPTPRTGELMIRAKLISFLFMVISVPILATFLSGQTFTYDAAASGNNGGVSGASGSINVSLTAGELVEANCEAYGGSASNTLSDSLGNTWHQAIGLTNPGELSEWYSVIAHGGSDTIQCQGSSGTSFVELGTVGEVSSTGWPASPLDQANAVYFSTASSCNVSTPAATSQPVELAIAGCATAGGVVGSASGWTLRQQWSSNSGAFFDSPLSSTGIILLIRTLVVLA